MKKENPIFHPYFKLKKEVTTYIFATKSLKDLRIKCGLSKRQVAIKSKVSAVFYGEIEAGKKSLSPEVLFRIMAVLNIGGIKKETGL